MLRRNNHISGAEQSVASCGINSEDITERCFKINLCATAFAYPIALLNLNTIYKINIIKVFGKPVCIIGDFKHPLALLFSDYL